MSSGMKGFVFNKKLDWMYNCYSYNVFFEDDLLVLGNKSFFFSHVLDSIELGNSWNNLEVKASIPENSKLIFRIFSSDSKVVLISDPSTGENNQVDIEECLSKNSNVNIKLNIFSSMNSLVFENPHDVPLFSLKGRYVVFCIEAISYSKEPIKIEEIAINFPIVSFLQYLPESYQSFPNNSFMSRFISIFQSIYFKVEDIIDNIPEKFEPSCTDREFLYWILKLFHLDVSSVSESSVRMNMQNIMGTFKIRGTRKSIFGIVKEYISNDPIIIEKFRIISNDYYKIEKKMVDKLFGKNNYYFTVILREDDVKNKRRYANLLKIISKVVPIDSICNLVLLTDNIILGFHCYIGVNSYISNMYTQRTGNKNLLT